MKWGPILTRSMSIKVFLIKRITRFTNNHIITGIVSVPEVQDPQKSLHCNNSF